ncbi:MAG: ribosome-associated translation inhibitor RaiA [Cyanobacteria bacterium P01_D01_bin.44]
MRLVIQGRNLEITDAINDYVHQKIGKAIDHFENLMNEVDVNLSVPRNLRGPSQQIAEVTVYANGHVIRAQEQHENLYASIDLVADKLTRQLKRYKDKRQRRTSPKETQGGEFEATEMMRDSADWSARTPELPPKVVRNKFFRMPPLSVQEALDNLQLVGHDFYMFQNAETGEINVIYERNHGGYGVLQPRRETGDRNGDS